MEKSAGKIVKIRDFVTRRGRWAAAGLVMLFYRFLPVRWQCSISGVSVLEIECISPSGGGRNARDGGHALISVSPRQANHCTFNNIYLYIASSSASGFERPRGDPDMRVIYTQSTASVKISTGA